MSMSLTELEGHTVTLPTVLVVDDHPGSREYVARLLRFEGFDVLRAGDAHDARQLLDAQHVDLILLDNMMPGVSGLEFLTTLRAEEKFHDLPVIMLSAVSEGDVVKQAKELGVRDYLIKSRFSINMLLERVRDNLAGRNRIIPS